MAGAERRQIRIPPAPNHQPPTPNNQPPNPNTQHPPPTTHHPPPPNPQPPTTNHQPPATNHQPPTTSHMSVAFVSNSDCGRHDTGWGHPEHVGRLRAVPRALREEPELLGRIQPAESRPATPEELALAHDA